MLIGIRSLSAIISRSSDCQGDGWTVGWTCSSLLPLNLFLWRICNPCSLPMAKIKTSDIAGKNSTSRLKEEFVWSIGQACAVQHHTNSKGGTETVNISEGTSFS